MFDYAGSSMRFFLMLVIVLLFPLGATSKTINAASCSQPSVAAALALANDGDIIFIPSGDCSATSAWSGTLNVNKNNLKIQGAGTGITILGISTPASAFHIAADNVTISGFTCDCKHNNLGYGFMLIGDSNTNPSAITRNFHVAQLTFVNCNDNAWPSAGTTGHPAISVRGYTYGLIDHNIFEDCNGESIDICADGVPLGVLRSQEYGQYTNGTVYIEDNTWNYIHEAENAVDGNSSSRYVVRYNTFNVGPSAQVNALISNHETCFTCSCDAGTRGDAGSSVTEVYENKIYNQGLGGNTARAMLSHRGGRALVYNNTVYSHDTYYGFFVTLRNSRSSDYATTNCSGTVHSRGYSIWAHDLDPGYTTEGRWFSKTTITSAIDLSATTIPIASVTDLPVYGVSIIIGSEQIDCNTVSGLNLTGCTRGANGTTKVSHQNAGNVDLLIFGQCLEQINNTYIWGNKTVGNVDKNGVVILTEGYNQTHNDYTLYDIKSYAERPQNWQYRNDGISYQYAPYPYPHPLNIGLMPPQNLHIIR